MPNLNGQRLVLIILCIIGAIVRFWNVGFQHMNWDEEWTIQFITGIAPWDLVVKTLSQDFTPPIYYLSAWLSSQAFGLTATAIRIPIAKYPKGLFPKISYQSSPVLFKDNLCFY